MAESQRVELNIPYPNAAELYLILRINGCHLALKGGDQANWVQGSSTFKRPPGPQVEQIGGEVIISQEYQRSELTNMFRVASDSPVLDLQVSPAQPFSLTVENLGDRSHLDLSGLPLQRLKISQRMGPGDLNFSLPNPIPLEHLEINAQAGQFEAHNLANANFKRLTLLGMAATYKLNFGGSLRQDALVEMRARQSPTTIAIPSRWAVSVQSADGTPFDPDSTELKLDSSFVAQDGGYCTHAALQGKTPLLTIQIAPQSPIALNTFAE